MAIFLSILAGWAILCITFWILTWLTPEILAIGIFFSLLIGLACSGGWLAYQVLTEYLTK
jgi:hypothetical protein